MASVEELVEIEERFRTIGYTEGLGRMWGFYPAVIRPASRLWPDVRANIRNAGRAAATFESGLTVLADQQQILVFRWHDTTALQRIVEHRRNGTLLRTTYQYQLTGPDGVPLTLAGGLADPQKWGREIQDGITRARLPVALQTVASGSALAFGPIEVNRRTVTAGGRSVPWSDVERIKVDKGEVSVRVAGKWLALIRTDVSRIPNFFVFYALAEALRTSAGSG
ncbi:hypothetical protein KGQ20_21855 [Catenulispora sp. NF23]|uniref:Uncharacterized protein n=1 Tax=Catenulispora pinistramenti TaxID=2705254 RepID=A0ABS5L390_9ACTN|nr:DUF6585 family protein [Catenulispora pinistramenti]MBS2535413.1 hypothetical protein [Catenulispora pinistramenti]MBS2552789.1 hypothetical protein [Catenulispora pinistramenti]